MKKNKIHTWAQAKRSREKARRHRRSWSTIDSTAASLEHQNVRVFRTAGGRSGGSARSVRIGSRSSGGRNTARVRAAGAVQLVTGAVMGEISLPSFTFGHMPIHLSPTGSTPTIVYGSKTGTTPSTAGRPRGTAATPSSARSRRMAAVDPVDAMVASIGGSGFGDNHGDIVSDARESYRTLTGFGLGDKFKGTLSGKSTLGAKQFDKAVGEAKIKLGFTMKEAVSFKSLMSKHGVGGGDLLRKASLLKAMEAVEHKFKIVTKVLDNNLQNVVSAVFFVVCQIYKVSLWVLWLFVEANIFPQEKVTKSDVMASCTTTAQGFNNILNAVESKCIKLLDTYRGKVKEQMEATKQKREKAKMEKQGRSNAAAFLSSDEEEEGQGVFEDDDGESSTRRLLNDNPEDDGAEEEEDDQEAARDKTTATPRSALQKAATAKGDAKSATTPTTAANPTTTPQPTSSAPAPPKPARSAPKKTPLALYISNINASEPSRLRNGKVFTPSTPATQRRSQYDFSPDSACEKTPGNMMEDTPARVAGQAFDAEGDEGSDLKIVLDGDEAAVSTPTVPKKRGRKAIDDRLGDQDEEEAESDVDVVLERVGGGRALKASVWIKKKEKAVCEAIGLASMLCIDDRTGEDVQYNKFLDWKSSMIEELERKVAELGDDSDDADEEMVDNEETVDDEDEEDVEMDEFEPPDDEMQDEEDLKIFELTGIDLLTE
ncbi:hypothetical protein HK101_008460 [Irineochytrium annulatum]|nr:hypothetical protein HK101_008460 [Irineochytrium annulatum]